MSTAVVVLNMPHLNEANGLGNLLNNPNLTALGKQKLKGQYFQIPAIVGRYKIKWVFDEDIYLTGLRYSQSAWKYQDSWTLYIDGHTIYSTIFTKEVGEYKHFNRFEFVEAGTEITFELSNDSGNSRDLWVDLEFLCELDYIETDITPEPDEETEVEPEPDTEFELLEDQPVSHDYDFIVTLDWESPAYVDLDLYLVVDNNTQKIVWYNSKDYMENDSHMWLDYDYRHHVFDNEGKKEIGTILGMSNRNINVVVSFFEHDDFIGRDFLTQNFEVEIYKKDGNSHRLIKTYSIEPDKLKRSSLHICDIDIDSETVTDVLKFMTSIGDI